MSPQTTTRVTVYVNDEPQRYYLGLRVRHAIGYRAAWQVDHDQAVVLDGEGDRIDLDGALYDGERLYVCTLD